MGIGKTKTIICIILSLHTTEIGGKKSMPDIQYLEHPTETDALMDKLSPPVRNWFREKF